ncbi:UNVERIFIED_CONTAM: hypothetical protein GTU68_031658 [Idotea baltica]|nr:hypothetical protein [Idotea baltica]
MGHPSRP